MMAYIADFVFPFQSQQHLKTAANNMYPTSASFLTPTSISVTLGLKLGSGGSRIVAFGGQKGEVGVNVS